MVFPPIHAFMSLSGAVKKTLGDIEYLATQEFNGNITRLEGDLSAVTNKLTHTATTGKDAYCLMAKIVPTGFVQAASRNTSGTTTGNNHTEAKISFNTVEKDRVTVGISSQAKSTTNNGGSGSGYGGISDGMFHNAVGGKVLAGQVIEIENTLDNGNARAQMIILEVSTGVTPKL